MKLIAVNDQNDGRRSNLRNVRTAQRKLAGKKSHGIGLAAAGCAEIGAALAAFLHNRAYNALLQPPCGEELRIAADDFHLVAVIRTVLKVDVIPENLQEPLRAVHTADHGPGFFKRKGGNLVAVIHATPCVEMLIGRANRPQARLDAIGDAG